MNVIAPNKAKPNAPPPTKNDTTNTHKEAAYAIPATCIHTTHAARFAGATTLFSVMRQLYANTRKAPSAHSDGTPFAHEAREVIALVRRNSAMQARMRDHVRRRGGNCHICGQPIDYTLPYYLPGTRKPNPEAYVADHVIPIDKGGAHDLSNGKPAHWRCNSKKRARLYAPIIKRSGALD